MKKLNDMLRKYQNYIISIIELIKKEKIFLDKDFINLTSLLNKKQNIYLYFEKDFCRHIDLYYLLFKLKLGVLIYHIKPFNQYKIHLYRKTKTKMKRLYKKIIFLSQYLVSFIKFKQKLITNAIN